MLDKLLDDNEFVAVYFCEIAKINFKWDNRNKALYCSYRFVDINNSVATESASLASTSLLFSFLLLKNYFRFMAEIATFRFKIDFHSLQRYVMFLIIQMTKSWCKRLPYTSDRLQIRISYSPTRYRYIRRSFQLPPFPISMLLLLSIWSIYVASSNCRYLYSSSKCYLYQMFIAMKPFLIACRPTVPACSINCPYTCPFGFLNF